MSFAQLRRGFSDLVAHRADAPLPGSLVEHFTFFVARRAGLPWDHDLVLACLELGEMYLDHRRYWNRLSKRRLAVAASDHPIPLPDDETQVGAFLEHISKRARNTHDPDAASSVGRRIAQNVVTNLLAARYLVQVHGEVYAAHNSFTRLFRPPYHLVEGSFVTRGLAPHAEWELFDAAGRIRTFDLRRFSCVPADPFEDERVRAHYLEALSLVLLQDTNDPLMLAFASQTASHVVNSHSRFKALLP